APGNLWSHVVVAFAATTRACLFRATTVFLGGDIEPRRFHAGMTAARAFDEVVVIHACSPFVAHNP
ncbi:hypothetical protein, partial [Paenibacillus taichungensis]|uniref:hypothetical protein n=1 Tax=Paenibacillus taichungensis TaxID=484184 RepID=UPI002872938A